ncbi:MAG TPA: hypothetical protein ENI02_02955 [Candidatus Aminicenantes bacterium]|nr:hypothetical protein [Candidatus Aminicenantes bacterium]
MPESFAADGTSNGTPKPVQQSSGGFGQLDKSGEIEPQEFDPTPFIGKDSMIAYIEEHEGQYGFFIKMFSMPVDEGNREIRASRLFGLQEDKDHNIGWGPKSPLALFLKKFNAGHYRDLIENPQIQEVQDSKAGKTFRRIAGVPKTKIKIQTRIARDEKEYLTF